MNDDGTTEPDLDYSLPLIRRELIRAAARATPPLTATEVKDLTVQTVQAYDIGLLTEAAENGKLDFAIGAYRIRRKK